MRILFPGNCINSNHNVGRLAAPYRATVTALVDGNVTMATWFVASRFRANRGAPWPTQRQNKSHHPRSVWSNHSRRGSPIP